MEKYFFEYTMDGIQMNIVNNIDINKAKDLYWRSYNKGVAGLYGIVGTEQEKSNDVKRLFNKGVKRIAKPEFNAEKTANEIMATFGVKLVAEATMHGEFRKEITYSDYNKYIAKCEYAKNEPECSSIRGGFRVIEVIFGDSKPYTYLVKKQYKKLGEVVINNRKAKVVSYNILTPKKLYEIADKNHKSVTEFFKVI